MKRFCAVVVALAVSGCAMMDTVTSVATGIDMRVPSNPDTVVWGHLPAERPPVARLRSGQTAELAQLLARWEELEAKSSS